MATTSPCANERRAQTTADRRMQNQDRNMHSTKGNTANRSYPVNHLQKAVPAAKLQDTQQRTLLVPSGAREELDMVLPNTLGIPGNRDERDCPQKAEAQRKCCSAYGFKGREVPVQVTEEAVWPLPVTHPPNDGEIQIATNTGTILSL